MTAILHLEAVHLVCRALEQLTELMATITADTAHVTDVVSR